MGGERGVSNVHPYGIGRHGPLVEMTGVLGVFSISAMIDLNESLAKLGVLVIAGAGKSLICGTRKISKFMRRPVRCSRYTCLKPAYMALHSNKGNKQKEREERLAGLMNTGLYECGVWFDGHGFKR